MIVGLLSMAGPACAGTATPKPGAPTPLIGDIIIFNDEIVEPVSAPISTCGAAVPIFARGDSACKDASRVSDDDA